MIIWLILYLLHSIYYLMNLKINPIANSLNGEITAPGSKSYSHRAFIAASLAEGISIINKPLTSGDVAFTLRILKSLATAPSPVKVVVESSSKPIFAFTNKLKPGLCFCYLHLGISYFINKHSFVPALIPTLSQVATYRSGRSPNLIS